MTAKPLPFIADSRTTFSARPGYLGPPGSNPVLRIRSGRRRRAAARIRSESDPLTPAEIPTFPAAVPDAYRTFYNVWFRLG
jgi:hypothetical protein